MTTKTKRNSQKKWIGAGVALVLLLLVVAGTALMSGGGDDAARTQATYAVERGPLTISLRATGNLRSAQSVTLTNDTHERTTIVYIIEEGTQVEEGDLLVELDSTAFEEELLEEEIEHEQARSELLQAESELEVVKQQAEADVDAARVDLELAKLDLEKYEAPQGEYEQALQEAENNITLAQAELERAEDQLAGSERLFNAGYITETELQADQLTQQRRQLDLTLAEGEKDLLERFTKRRTLSELTSARNQAEFELTKVEHRTQSDIADAEARLQSRRLSYEREKEGLARVKRQIEACEIRAPTSGMVVHGTSGGGGRRDQEPLAEGIEVHPRQDLILLPTADKMIADVKIQEAMLHGLRDRISSDDGVRVKITTDALPDQTFEGRVKRVAVMPDAQSRWLNPDLKVYNTEVELTGDTSALWSGMSCQAEIIIEELDDATYVPLQAVMRVSGEHTVYVPTSNGPQAKRVEVGLDNNRMVQVVSGLEAGEQVLLNPPLAPSERPERREREEEEQEEEGPPSLPTETAGTAGDDAADPS